MSTAVIDTNVVVAGVLTHNETSPVARILEAMLTAAFPYAVSQDLLTEYRTVLERPSLRRLHGLTADEIETLVVALAETAIVLSPACAPSAPDPKDQFLWDLLAARADLILVTGDKPLFAVSLYVGRIITPRGFVETW